MLILRFQFLMAIAAFGASFRMRVHKAVQHPVIVEFQIEKILFHELVQLSLAEMFVRMMPANLVEQVKLEMILPFPQFRLIEIFTPVTEHYIHRSEHLSSKQSAVVFSTQRHLFASFKGRRIACAGFTKNIERNIIPQIIRIEIKIIDSCFEKFGNARVVTINLDVFEIAREACPARDGEFCVFCVKNQILSIMLERRGEFFLRSAVLVFEWLAQYIQ